MIRHVPYWIHRFPKSQRPSYPRFRGHLEIDVAIVGGGATGCMTLYACAAAGVGAALFEAERIGEAGSGAAMGVLRHEPDPPFRAIEAAYGRSAARRIFAMSRRAALDCAATVRRLGIRGRLAAADGLQLAREGDEAKRLRRESDARRGAGIEAVWVTPRALLNDTAIEGHAAIRSHGHSRVDPFRACLGFARAAEARGARLFERAPIRRIRAGRRSVDLTLAEGTVRATHVIVATGSPAGIVQPLARHVIERDTYAVVTPPLPARVRKALGRTGGGAWLRDMQNPPHRLQWIEDDRVLFAGGDQPRTPARLREKTLVQRTGQLMYELTLLYPAISGIQPEYSWAAPLVTTADGLPLIGPHRNYPHHLFALGLGHNGLTAAFLASRILLRAHLGEAAKGDELFGFNR